MSVVMLLTAWVLWVMGGATTNEKHPQSVCVRKRVQRYKFRITDKFYFQKK